MALCMPYTTLHHCGAVVFASYDTWMTDTDIDVDIEPPLEPEGPWQVCNNYIMYIVSV